MLVKWRQLGYDHATWEQLSTLPRIEFADVALARLRSLQPITVEAEQLRQVQPLWLIHAAAAAISTLR